jgi:hypothetical protein
MISAWTQHLKTEEDKKAFEKDLRSSLILERLKEIIQKDKDNLSLRETSPKVYDNPNWAYRQAHANGYMSCLNEYLTLLNLDIKDNNEHAVRPELRPGIRPE